MRIERGVNALNMAKRLSQVGGNRRSLRGQARDAQFAAMNLSNVIGRLKQVWATTGPVR